MEAHGNISSVSASCTCSLCCASALPGFLCSSAVGSRLQQTHRFLFLNYRDTPLSGPSGTFGKGSCYAFLSQLINFIPWDSLYIVLPMIPLTSLLISVCLLVRRSKVVHKERSSLDILGLHLSGYLCGICLQVKADPVLTRSIPSLRQSTTMHSI